MEQAQVYGQLTNILRDVLMNDDLVVSSSLSARDVEGWDSFKMIEIIMAVEAQFNIHIPSQQVDRLETVGDLATLILSKGTATVV